ncbi:MAG: hypothetical protein V3S51_07820, partial [Dehalococcoidia bacterium]
WRLLNQGVAPERSTTVQIDDTAGILESYSKVDVDLASLGGNDAAFRASEDNAFISGMNSTVATALFYGNQKANPEQMHGLAPRYNSLTGDYSSQIINGGGSGSDNTSIWLITWGPQTVSLMFPKGSQAGLVAEDMGKQLITDSSNRMYTAWVTKFQWKLGLVLRDFRYAIRICNIDDSELTSSGASGADILNLMIDAYYARPTVDLGNQAKTFFYCNKTIAKFLHKQAQNKSNVNLSIDDPAGKAIVKFLDAPIRVCDNLTVAEATVS